MEPTVKRIILKRFRSIPAEQIDFDNPTIFVGRNGSGKSNLVSAFAFLAETMASPLQAVFDKAGGISSVRNRSSGRSYPPNLGLRVDLGRLNGKPASGFYAFEVRALPNYGFAVVREQCSVGATPGQGYWFDRIGGNFRSNVPGLNPSLDPASLGLPLVGGEAKFAPVLRTLAAMRVYSIEPGKLREMQEPDSGTSLRSDGSNVTSVLQEVRRQSADDFHRIWEILASIVPNTKKVEVKKHGNRLSLEFTQEWGERKRLKFEGFSMSDGTLRAIGLLAAVFQRPAPSLIAVEEPEATIHPGALDAVLDLLRHACKHMQVIITTHSPELLDAKWITDRHLRVVEWAEGATRVSPVSDATRTALRGHLMGGGRTTQIERSGASAAFPRESRATGALRNFGMIIQPIIEGQGDEEAVPLLLRRLRDQAEAWALEVGKPIRQRRTQLVRKDSLQRAVKIAAIRADSVGILVVIDADDDCPRELAPQLQLWVAEAARGISSAVVLANREYEAWFLAELGGFRLILAVSELVVRPN